jgi:predicted Zn-ribbon and HTH transcriptional regulator
MKKKTERLPVQRNETIRRQIMEHLRTGEFSARQLSGDLGVQEKEVYDHLAHIKRTMHRGGQMLVVTPPECRKCGFIFVKMERFRRPGKCPLCKEESVHEPLFTVKQRE